MQKPTMGDLVVIGFCHLRTLFGTYKQFASSLCHVFKICNVHKSLWKDPGPQLKRSRIR